MPEITIIEVLKGARNRVERGWCQRAGARDAAGSTILVTSPDAVSYCIGGALHAARAELVRFQKEVGAEAEGAARQRLRDELGNEGRRGLERWNDHPRRTQAEVVALFEATIAGLK